MAQHDLNIANADGATVRADLNGALAALGTTMKGPTVPPAPQAGLTWLDDSASPWTLRIYDGVDWIVMGTVDPSNDEYAPALPDGVITFTKFQSIATARLLGRSAVGSGAVEEISIGAGLSLAAGVLSAEGSGVPTGTIVPTAATTEPSGWLFCYGQAVNRTTYAALYAAIGTNYGVGDGSTTFNVPDLRGRVVAGRDNMGGAAADRLTSGGSGINGAALGAAGGTETQTLTEAQMPAHFHDYAARLAPNLSGSPHTGGNTSVGDGSTSGPYKSSETRGGGQPHPNTQPTLVLNYIIKA